MVKIMIKKMLALMEIHIKLFHHHFSLGTL